MVQIDISMPQSCDDCPFLLVDYKTNVPDCDLMEDLPNCPEYDWNTPMGQRDKNCPLREVPKGKWVWVSSTFDRTPCEMRFRCSNCLHETITHGQEPWDKFCPNCGAYMGKEPKRLEG